MSEGKDEVEADLPRKKKVMINVKASVLVTDETHDDENHEGDISPYGRHGVYEGRGEAAGAWNNRCLAHSWWCIDVSPNDGTAHEKIARQVLLKRVR